MSNLNKKTREAVRMVGHLLETNGTTQAFARTKSGKETNLFGQSACKFCLDGANSVVANKLGLNSVQLDLSIHQLLETNDLWLGGCLINSWDEGSRADRKKIVEVLKNA